MSLTVVNISKESEEVKLRPRALTQKGNLIPNNWYYQIKSKSGRPDFAAISILSEIVFKSRPQKIYDPELDATKVVSLLEDGAVRISYKHFQGIFGYNRQKVRRGLVRLEELSILKREFRNCVINGTNRHSILFIRLEPSFAKSLFQNEQNFDSGIRSKSCKKEVSKSAAEYGLQKCSPTILYKKYQNRYLSSSNFICCGFKGQNASSGNSSNQACKSTINTNSALTPNTCYKSDPRSKPNWILSNAQNFLNKLKPHSKKLSISDMPVLTEDECELLRLKSARGFSSSYIRKHVLMLSKKLSHLSFFRREDFLKYMSISLENELRQVTSVNNDGFTFARGDEERAQEKYLEAIEYSVSNSDAARLKRKIAGIFDPKKAYEILYSSSFGLNEQSGIFRFKSCHIPVLSKAQQNVLLDQIRSVYGQSIRKIEFSSYEYTKKNDLSNPVMEDNNKTGQPAELVNNLTLWGRIRQKIQSSLGSAIDKAWFSKLIAEEDKENKRITLKAPTAFFSSYIDQHYRRVIETYCEGESYCLSGIGVA